MQRLWWDSASLTGAMGSTQAASMMVSQGVLCMVAIIRTTSPALTRQLTGEAAFLALEDAISRAFKGDPG
jgi:hypothetical protein